MIENYVLERIRANPWQTRIKEPDAEYIKELALDIARNGLLQIPIGRAVDGQAELAFGHNRLAAFLWLNDVKDHSDLQGDWSQMPVDIRELSDEQMAMLAWSENEKRRDITPIERARAIEKRMESFGWSNREAAEALGIDHSTISNILRILKLPADLQEAVQEGKLSERQGQTLVVLFEMPAIQEVYYYQKRSIIQEALRGASSDILREKVDGYLQCYGNNLEKAGFKLSQLIPEGKGVYCGYCSNCDKRMASRNLCFDEQCFEAKTKFVRRQYLEQASLISGYGILDDEKSGFPTDLYSHLEEIKATKCPNLVLTYGDTRDTDGQIPNFPHAHLVCEKRNQSCTCLAGLLINKSETIDTEKTFALEEDLPDHLKSAYYEYLSSEGWKAKRNMILEYWGFRCGICYKNGDLEVHHRTYERLGHEDVTDLIPLCEEHHKMVHGIDQ